MKKKTPYNQVAAIRGSLRRCFSRSPVIREVLLKVRREVPRIRKDGSRAKKDAVQYLCGACNKYVGSTHVSVDHIIPVVPESGFTNWSDFINRLFCGPENLRVLCDECHDAKSLLERRARDKIKDQTVLTSLESRRRFLDPKEIKLLNRLKKKLEIK